MAAAAAGERRVFGGKRAGEQQVFEEARIGISIPAYYIATTSHDKQRDICQWQLTKISSADVKRC